MSQAIAYLRVSTERQAESGLGLEAQRASVTACAARLGIPLASVLIDGGTSGSLTIEDRPVLLDAVASLKRGDVLLVAKRDRLGRDVIAVAMIDRLVSKRGARVVSAAGEGSDSNDPSSILMRRLIDSFGEYERLIIAARTKAALSAKRQRGERISRFAPFGFVFANDGMLEPELSERQTLDLIRKRRAAGDTLRAVANHLNDLGLRTRAGSPWRFQHVQTALRCVA